MIRKALLALFIISSVPAFAGVRVLVPAHDIARGQVVSEADFTYTSVASTPMNGIITSVADVAGMETRRTLRAGETLRSEDLRRPVIITKGSMVTMVFEAPGIVLTGTGRALSGGGLGETITIQNPSSYRQITAVVIGPGQVRAASNSAQFASIQQ